MEASKQQLVLAPKFDEAPSLPTLPKAGCLLTVYCRDVLSRLEEVKAYITSTFGGLLKIDSTKKVKYHKQINFISKVIFCLWRKHRHIGNKTNQVPQIVHYTPPPNRPAQKYFSCYSSNCYNYCICYFFQLCSRLLKSLLVLLLEQLLGSPTLEMNLAKFLTAPWQQVREVSSAPWQLGSSVTMRWLAFPHQYFYIQIVTAVVRKRSALSSQPGRNSMCALMHGTSCNVLQQGALQIHIHSMVPLWLDCHSAFLSGVVRNSTFWKEPRLPNLSSPVSKTYRMRTSWNISQKRSCPSTSGVKHAEYKWPPSSFPTCLRHSLGHKRMTP